jgi:hypothetical protein
LTGHTSLGQLILIVFYSGELLGDVSKSPLISALSTVFAEKYKLEAATLDFTLFEDSLRLASSKGVFSLENILERLS